MKRLHRPIKQTDVERWTSEGRGTTSEAGYTEWMDVRAFSSRGQTSRMKGAETGELHTSFSQTEEAVMLALELSRTVRQMQAQRRLEPSLTQAAAAVLEMEHPDYVGSSVPFVMTVDCLAQHNVYTHEIWRPEHEADTKAPQDLSTALDLARGDDAQALVLLEQWGVLLRTYDDLVSSFGRWQWTAYDSKLLEDVLHKRTLQLLSISRLASHHLGWQHVIVAKTAVPRNVRLNLAWLRRGRRLEHEVETPPGLFTDLPNLMLAELAVALGSQKVEFFCSQFEKVHGLDAGIGLRVLQILAWTGRLMPNVRTPDLAKETLAAFPLTRDAKS